MGQYDDDLYRASGVDIDAGNEAVNRIKPHVLRTMRKEVLGSLGGFGGGFLFDKNRYDEPVLVSGTDGVGTKLKLAFALDCHDTIGIDAVAMCVNDILAMGAEPLFFLDYFATGKLSPAVMEQVVKGVAEGCVDAHAALIGGETAEMPGMYPDGEYDLAGFAVGVAEKSRMMDKNAVKKGDILLGLPSSGVHSNGFSMVRKLIDDHHINLMDTSPELTGTIGEALLAPTRIYVSSVLPLLETISLSGMAHITGGGLTENVPRALPDGLGCEITLGSWPMPAIFSYLTGLQEISHETLYRTWNMGIGYVLVVHEEDVTTTCDKLREFGETPYVIGRVIAGDGVVYVGENQLDG